jgi:hypothetical protein
MGQLRGVNFDVRNGAHGFRLLIMKFALAITENLNPRKQLVALSVTAFAMLMLMGYLIWDSGAETSG